MKLTNIILAFLLALFSSCKKENRCDCFKRTGSIVTETREVSGFDKIVADDNLNVFITQDSMFNVKIEAGDNLIPLIKTEVTNDILYIRNKNRCNWTRSYDKPFNVYVTLPLIRSIISEGIGNIKSLNTISNGNLTIQTKNSGDVELMVNSVKIVSNVHGTGDLTLHGTVNEHYCDIGGTAFLNCQDLITNYTYVHTYTTGLSYVNATGTLNCKIDKIGDVYCYGNPVTIQKIQIGKGQLFLK